MLGKAPRPGPLPDPRLTCRPRGRLSITSATGDWFSPLTRRARSVVAGRQPAVSLRSPRKSRPGAWSDPNDWGGCGRQNAGFQALASVATR